MSVQVLLSGLLTIVTLVLPCPSVVAQDTSEYQSVAREYYRRLGVWIVPATMVGKNGLAMLATGSNAMAVNSPNGANDFPDQVLLPRGVVSQASTVFAAMPFSCLGLPPKTDFAIGMNLSPLYEVIHMPISALAAMPYLRKHVIRLDPGNGKIEILCAVEASNDDLELEIRWQENTPSVQAELPVLGPRPFIVETGCWGYLELEADRVKALERMGHIFKHSSVEAFNVNFDSGNTSKTAIPIYFLRWLEFGGIRFHNVPLKIGAQDQIGLGLLHYFRTTLDFPGDRVYLEPLIEADAVNIPRPGGGASLAFHDADRLVVDSLMDDYPARRLGIEVGDLVLSLNGLTPPELSRHKITEILSQADSTVSLELQRVDRRFQVDLNLDHPFPWPPAWEPELPTFDPDAETAE